MDHESTARRATREAYERRFINAETAYDKYIVFKDLLSWIDDLQKVNDSLDKLILDLRREVKGYDLKDYIE